MTTIEAAPTATDERPTGRMSRAGVADYLGLLDHSDTGSVQVRLARRGVTLQLARGQNAAAESASLAGRAAITPVAPSHAAA